jgi:protein O-mannosyl-transferase
MTARKRKKLKQKLQTAHPWIFKPVWLLLVMLAIGLVTYAPELKGNFIFDDIHYVQHNPNLKDFSTLIHWNEFQHSRPLYWFSLFLEKNLWGNNPAGYKVVNLSFHVLTAFILFFFLLRLLELKGIYDRWFALAASMLFLVSPLATEAVSYISGRNNGIGGFFFILGCFLYLKTLTFNIQRKRITFFASSLASFVTAFLFKEVYIVFVLFYPLLYLWVRPFQKKRMMLGIGGIISFFMAVLVLSFTLNISPFTQIHSAIVKNSHHFNSQPLATNTYAVAYSLRLFAFPNALNIDHDLPVLNSLTAPRVLMAIALLLAIGFLLFFFRRKLPLSFPAYLGYLILIAPTNSFILRHGKWMIDPLSERNLYACAIFFSIILSDIIMLAIQKKRYRTYAIVILILISGARTFTRNIDFRTDTALWSAAAKYSPARPRVQFNLAIALKDTEKTEDAIEHARMCLQLDPNAVQAYGLLADLYFSEKRPRLAIETLELGIQTCRGIDRAYLMDILAMHYYQTFQFSKAEQYFRKSTQINPKAFLPALHRLLNLLNLEHWNAAAQALTKVRKLYKHTKSQFRPIFIANDDSDYLYHFASGWCQVKTGHPKKGINQLKRAIELEPYRTEPYLALCEYYYHNQQLDLAFFYLQRAAQTPSARSYSKQIDQFYQAIHQQTGKQTFP